jgi:ketosteroid isomerase-like protein
MALVTETQRKDIEELYAAFNRRDIDAAIERLAGDVHWANGMEGGYVDGAQAVREYWTRQFEVIQSRVEPEHIRRLDDGRIAVDVHQVVRATTSSELLADHHVAHIFTFRDGEITTFDIDPQ